MACDDTDHRSACLPPSTWTRASSSVSTGVDAPLDYLLGAFESDDFIVPYTMRWTTDYVLEPHTPLLRVTTTIHAEADLDVAFGDVLNALPVLGSIWAPGAGRVGSVPTDLPWVAYVDEEQGQTLGVFRDAQLASPNAGLDVLNFLLSVVSLFDEPTTVASGDTYTWTRWYGVGDDPARLTDAWHEATDTVTDTVQASVTAGVRRSPGRASPCSSTTCPTPSRSRTPRDSPRPRSPRAAPFGSSRTGRGRRWCETSPRAGVACRASRPTSPVRPRWPPSPTVVRPSPTPVASAAPRARATWR
jgi:hypothetical protein